MSNHKTLNNKESLQEKITSKLANLMEIIDDSNLESKWQKLAKLLDEALKQKHFLSSFYPIEINRSDPNWRNLIGQAGYMQYNLEGETLFINPEEGLLWGREKVERDEYDRLLKFLQMSYSNQKEDPLATDNPLEVVSYEVEYQAEKRGLDVEKLLYAKYDRDQSFQEVATYWIEAPASLLKTLKHIQVLKTWSKRQLYVKYLNQSPVSAHILEYDSVASPQIGDCFLLRRSIEGSFKDNRLTDIKAFERLGLNLLQKNLKIELTDAGSFRETIEIANA